ncbi:hypothetical protein EV196_110133 [Mariniflexile fucanivorans]|uniref:Parallel beta helix pectate lyase-like protein n=1 Tax=Mariniflexile fucanivorans TaxID=264023 RepID=A0A4R1RC79_9FLAO|nr:hypothetical protein [Mariniflexile fucanivorans]TCL63180.1 hypothetical protein EV196_110133 [Mariniflexile fucanivorans]
MKNLTQMTFIFLFIIGNIYGQQEKGIIGANNWLYNWTEFKPNQKQYDEPTQILAGNIDKDKKLVKRETYMLLGNVFVTNNATLTIEPGTVIICDFASKASLTITKGSKIVADGLETDPIIFTSNRGTKRSGDWGGIILLGDAPTNKFGNGSVASYYSDLAQFNYSYTNYGGSNAESNSGILRYVRIEFAGKRIKGDEYYNGLLLAGVGNKTIFDNVMVSYSGGNSFEILGGDTCLNKLVAYRSNSDDFKFNYGAQCKIDNSLAIRSPYISSSSAARCLQIASYNKMEEVDFTKKGTNVEANNLTFLNDSESLNSDMEKGLVKEAIFIGQNASLNMNKSVVSGFNPAVILESSININQQNLEKIQFANMFFNNCKGNIFLENDSNNEDLENWYGNSAFFNVYSKSNNAETFIDFSNEKRPDFRLRINKIIASKDATYAQETKL